MLGEQRRSLCRLTAAARTVRRAELHISRVVALGCFWDCIAAQAMPLFSTSALLAKVILWLLIKNVQSQQHVLADTILCADMAPGISCQT